jgi:D-lactate dehydrogenase
MSPSPYDEFSLAISRSLPPSRIHLDDLSRLAFGTDASFYRLLPEVVVRVESIGEVSTVLREASSRDLAVTFRAAGTSLSGQAVSDSILVMLGRSWRGMEVLDGGARIRLQPGVVGSAANAVLAPFGRKIGPDPASINAAMVGGIAANNASGMCCGTAQNSYRTLASLKVLLADGSLLDTGDPASKAAFRTTNGALLRALAGLSERVRGNRALADRIRRKYGMKNTTGYSLNALVDFSDPFDILEHLMIGSEGTLGFIAEITYHTVPEHPHKSTALLLFPDIRTACAAVPVLKRCRVDAVELMDRASLASVEDKPGMPGMLKELGQSVAALLVETRAGSADELAENVHGIAGALESCTLAAPPAFTSDPVEFSRLWDIRKGLFPSVGARRRAGTTVIIEDVAFPVDRLAEATMELQRMFHRHNYPGTIIFGHALEGNLHFVFTQDFNRSEEVEKYRAFMDDVAHMVVGRYDGSLKAEHGTGRNMAPFVELEWGADAVGIMREIKEIFDPRGILNPGVILNPDPAIHLKNLKPLPAAHPVIDSCIECGFCEVHCPSRDLTLTPRQRIVVTREIARLSASRMRSGRARGLTELFRYAGEQTCATDGLCATACPVGIDTGALVKSLRGAEHGWMARAIAAAVASNMASATALLRLVLRGAAAAHRVLGTGAMESLAAGAHRLSGKRIPLWNRAMPRAAVFRAGGAQPRSVSRPNAPQTTTHSPAPAGIALRAGSGGGSASNGGANAVVYFPTCITRTMGPTEKHRPSLPTLAAGLIERAGYELIIPRGFSGLCCGMAFSSKGFQEAGDRKARELREALMESSGGGRLPILMDMSPCLYRMRSEFGQGLRLYDQSGFALEFLAPRLQVRVLPRTVAVHATCSARKLGLAGTLQKTAALCAERVIAPADIECCGWAGDRGFSFPELNESALLGLRKSLPPECSGGYSTSRTCEIGLTLHGGIPYEGILYLVDEASQ